MDGRLGVDSGLTTGPQGATAGADATPLLTLYKDTLGVGHPRHGWQRVKGTLSVYN